MGEFKRKDAIKILLSEKGKADAGLAKANDSSCLFSNDDGQKTREECCDLVASLEMAIIALQEQELTDQSQNAFNDPKDCISRKAAIEAMGKAQWAKDRIEELPSVQPETHWIPCSERMPGIGIAVLDDTLSVNWISYENNELKWGIQHEVPAWMQLPRPYKKDTMEVVE